MERELIANGLLDKRWSDNFPRECQRGPRTLELGKWRAREDSNSRPLDS